MALDKVIQCRWCGHVHGDLCPQVKAYEFNDDGSIRRVEFFAPVDHIHPELLEAARQIAEQK